jgi:hypothetical protein
MLGPDASRYVLAGQGERVAKPFHLRILLPLICRDDLRRWLAVWGASWVIAAAGLAWWGYEAGFGWPQVAALVALCLALQGVWGPSVVRPIGVDLPALALGVVAVAACEAGLWPLGVAVILVAASIKESAPVWAALWAWNPVLLVGLIVPAVVHLMRRPVMDRITEQPILRHVHDHPVRSAFEHQRRRHGYRNGWVLVAPWGATLAALVAPSWQLAAVLVVAHLQLVVATDTVRLLHTAAGPAMAFAAVQVIPTPWLLLAVVLHVCWWRQPELQ